MTVEISNKTRNDDGSTSWTETETRPELIRTRTVTATEWAETVLNCYCCSCADGEWGISIDPYCRNHGGVHGTRPCDQHGMPGQADDDGEMPESVQAVIARRKETHNG